ncbi:MAG: YciI family protein [Chitinophagaceae bacterium]
MKDYLLLFRGGDPDNATAQQDPAKRQAQMEKWKSWMENIGKEGKLVSGLPLTQDGAVINGTKKTITDGPFAEGKEIVGGYLIIKAGDKTEAIDVSSHCPILENDGSVEVRELSTMNM